MFNRKRFVLLFITFIEMIFVHAQARTDAFLREILAKDSSSILQMVLKDAQKFRCQVVYTEINRDRRNIPKFKNYYFNYDSSLYFNPASTVKMPLAFLSLEKLSSLNKKGVDKYSIVQFDSSFAGQTIAYSDSTAENDKPSIAQYIRKAFLISDNDAYNRMYEWVGQQSINKNLHAKGYPGVRITRQFMGFSAEQNRHTNPVRFIDKDNGLVYSQPPAYNTDSFYFPRQVRIGNGYMNARDSLINEPIDFTQHNNASVKDYQQMLQSVMFPASVPAKQRFKLSKDDYEFLYKFLSQYPSETNYPYYDTSVYYDSYVKFFFKQGSHSVPQGVRVFNKVGWAYGFLTDISYVADFTNKVEFMLTATIYVNSDGVLNDNKYDYDSIGYPFMYQLGKAVYRHELSRKRSYQPDLSAFDMEYDKRDPADKRRPIRDADN